ncbi:hypothetical protein SEA_TELAVIV_39 [Mycobacterium phage TelAviv]|uniref:Uncharacterized protein n=1 Tax=Mycobacterium phage Firecracker TaxID=2922998 RepID=G8I424_9CAUD|nr:hypothetical protein CL96_gp042 [Mycobacterium phage Firecracker]AVI04073.1 hypothetical protein SEA_JANGDYNASTY_42 [Mycobacterium phage JangDynasty]AVP42697.1 hypothetical protein SEA_SCHOOLBUS_42 [Mycobacterium phage SchoolBus]QGJ87364.1 hypothetical protein SEA_BLESSICA_43 [Mycobacterium phage Blessica]QPO16527.1 hypothetical protein SEA_TELAVIV_39 [Mycobacterium phage TelAviv]QWY81528.1 hypothetical protein SEA_WINGET_43 [Mycobacterium phage Winget]
MAITVEVKPDFSAFRGATVEEVVAAVGVGEATAEKLLEHFILFPR